MKTITRLTVVFLCSVLISYYNSYPQDGAPINTAEKFNERGYKSSAVSLLDGNEIISEYDGNLNIVYSTPYDVPNNIAFNLTTTFNANIAHKTFKQGTGIRFSGYSLNKPGWIIGIKGFAIQTTNFEVNYYMSSENRMLYGEEIPLLIPGYHYTNRSVPDAKLLNEGSTLGDYIQILRDDGSVLSLYNTDSFGNVGRYIETNSDGYGYAVVEWRPDNPDLRRMWYKPGDGLTYFFEEEAVKYNGRDSAAYLFNAPKIMYLKTIASENWDTLSITYSDWEMPYFKDFNPAGLGRKLFDAISSNRRTITARPSDDMFQLTSIYYNIYDRLGENHLADIQLIHQYHGTISKFIMLQNTSSPIFDPNMYGEPSSTKIRYISHIVDELGRFNSIEYDAKYRDYSNGSIFSFQNAAYLPVIAKYHNGKKTIFTYKTPIVDVYEYKFLSPGGDCTSVNYSNMPTLNATYRDDYSNFMMEERLLYNTYPSSYLVQKEEYDYVWSGSNNAYSMCYDVTSDIKTKISRTSYISGNSSSSTTVTTKNYTKYRTHFKPIFFDDYGAGVIRLYTETIQDGAKKSMKINDWDDTGIYSDMFWLLSTEEKIIDGPTSSKKTYYEYESIVATGYGKRLKTKVIITDPQGLKKETVYTSFLPPDYNDETGYYNIELKSDEKVYSGSFGSFGSFGSLTKSHDIFTYFSSGEKIGKLQSVTKNAHSRSTTITNDYYNLSGEDGDSVYYGFLKSQTLSNGIIKKFYYPRYGPYKWGEIKYYEIQDIAYGYLVTNDNVRTYQAFATENYQTKPFRTDIIYNNSLDTLRTWTSYDTKGNLLFEIGVNGNYSEYNYDVG